jgi:hypothetical protein
MKKSTEEIIKPFEESAVEVTIAPIETPIVSSKTIQNALTFYEVSFPVNGLAKLRVTDRLNGLRETIKLLPLTEAEFDDEAILKAKLIK